MSGEKWYSRRRHMSRFSISFHGLVPNNEIAFKVAAPATFCTRSSGQTNYIFSRKNDLGCLLASTLYSLHERGNIFCVLL
jgi:hypothetical protein